MDEPDFVTNYFEANNRALRKEIRKARNFTKGILGVNIMVAMYNLLYMVRTAIKGALTFFFRRRTPIKHSILFK